MMNARSLTLVAALLGGAACATTPAVPGPGKHTIHFRGYRLDLDVNDKGVPTAARAFKPSGDEVQTRIVPLADVNSCVVDPLGTGARVFRANDGKGEEGAPLYCGPMSGMNDGTNWVSGTGTLCHYYQGGQVIYYPC